MAEEWITKDYDGGATPTVLDGPISGVTTVVDVVDGSGLPDGASGKFVLVIDRGEATEEKVLVTSRAGNVLTVSQRGYDGTAAVAHLDDADVEHCLDAHSMKQANALAAIMASVGSMAYRSSASAYAELPVPGNGYTLVTVGGVPTWITYAALQTILLAGAAGNGLSVAAGVLAVGVDDSSIEISGDQLRVKASGVTAAMLNAAIAGAGLAGGAGTALSVVVDNTSIEINVDTLRVKAGGITAAMLAGGITSALITDATIVGGDIAADTVGDANVVPGAFPSVKSIQSSPLCGRAYRTTDQTIANDTVTILVGTTEDGDPSTMHNVANGHITCPSNGWIHVDANAAFDASVSVVGYRQIMIKRYAAGGALLSLFAFASTPAGDGATDFTEVSCSGLVEVAATDIVRVEVYHNSGGNLDVAGGVIESGYSWHYVYLT